MLSSCCALRLPRTCAGSTYAEWSSTLTLSAPSKRRPASNRYKHFWSLRDPKMPDWSSDSATGSSSCDRCHEDPSPPTPLPRVQGRGEQESSPYATHPLPPNPPLPRP